MKTEIKLIYCKNELNYIGKKGNLLYDFKKDKEIFRKETNMTTVIMGYNTYKELGKPLVNRNNIVIISQKYPMPYFPDNVIVAYDLKQAIEKAKMIVTDIYILGGGKIYTETIQNEKELNINIVEVHETLVIDKQEGDVTIPSINYSEYKLKKDVQKLSDLNRITNEYNSLIYSVFIKK